MAGRGRGRGGGLSLTHEQLQVFGITRGENNATTLAPPPLFPKLEAKPLPLVSDATTDYMLIVKDQFIEYLHESPAYVKPKAQTDGIERYSDKYKILALNAKQGKALDCIWANMPTELRPQTNKAHITSRKRKLNDAIQIAKRLQTLEKKEIQENNETMATNETDYTVKNENANDDDEEIEDEQEEEFEVDDGTDYANNFFDNGENYDEEDDNLDDGPVY